MKFQPGDLIGVSPKMDPGYVTLQSHKRDMTRFQPECHRIAKLVLGDIGMVIYNDGSDELFVLFKGPQCGWIFTSAARTVQELENAC